MSFKYLSQSSTCTMSNLEKWNKMWIILKYLGTEDKKNTLFNWKHCIIDINTFFFPHLFFLIETRAMR